MVYITGDTHADLKRFSSINFPCVKDMTKADYIIICGDFGGVWDDSVNQSHWLDWLDTKPFTTLFVSGNHENFDLLRAFPEKEWSGGRVQYIRPSVIHLLRGQVFTINNKRFFTMGGASSHDIRDGILEPDDPDLIFKRQKLERRNALFRINNISWWKEELPSDEEYAIARKNLDACGWQVDYIVTHCAPTSVANMLGSGIYRADRLIDFLQEVSERCEFDQWYFDHYHDCKTIMEKYHLLYKQIMEA